MAINQNLLMAAMLGGGQSLLQGQNPISGMIPVGQQYLGAKSAAGLQQQYLQMLRQMLGGMPAGAKMSGDKDNLSFKVPTSALASGGQNQGGLTGEYGDEFTPYQSGPMTAGGSVGAGEQPRIPGFLNPSSSPLGTISDANLVGLTPSDVAKAFGGASSVASFESQLKDKKFSDLVDAAYKMNLMKQAETQSRIATSKEMRGWAEMLRTSPLEVPGLGELSFDDWKSLDTKTKAYSYYAFDAKQRGEGVMPYNEWANQVDEPTIKEIYDLAEADEGFKEFFFEQKKAGATRISLGEKKESWEAQADVKSKKYFTDPKGFAKDVESYKTSREFRIDTVDSTEKEKIQKVENYVRGKISAAGGKIDMNKSRVEGRTFIFVVEWPDGTTSEVRYAN